jgi:hypothetical protein
MDWDTQETFRRLQNKPGNRYQESDATEKRIFREWLNSLLRSSVVTIEFLKSDNSLRVMRGTLKYELIPTDKYPSTNTTVDDGIRESIEVKRNNEDLQTIFDLDKGEWRSFRYDRLKAISISIDLK